MNRRLVFSSVALLVWLFTAAARFHSADAPPTLTVQEQNTPLYAQQDIETEPIQRLAKGETLAPLAESVAGEIWYMVRTKQGQVGWVRAVQVNAGGQVKEVFREKAEPVSNWAAVPEDGKSYAGSYTVDPGSSAGSARGFWTLNGPGGAVLLRGTWSMQIHGTGWNGTWRAALENRGGDYNGSWSAELPATRAYRLNELFESAAKEAIKGLWTGANRSGSWSARTFNAAPSDRPAP